jgi:hypothetical protein
MPAKKRPRTSNDIFCTEALFEALKVFAMIKKLAWDFEFMEYAKSRRCQGPDREGLEYYFEALEAVLKFAPGGFPSLALLRIIWVQLQDNFDVMADEVKAKYKKSGVNAWATDAGDKIRLMCSHVMDLKRSGSTFLSPKLQALVALIKPPSGKELEPPDEVPVPEAKPARILRREASASVEITRVSCQCEECLVKAPAIDADEEALAPTAATCSGCAAGRGAEAEAEAEDSDHSSTSRAPMRNMEHVHAARGGHKKQVEALKRPAVEALKKPAAAQPEKAKPIEKATKDTRKARGGHEKADDAAGVLKVALNTRNTPNRKESIVIVNGKYVAQCSEKQSPRYKDIMKQVKEELENKTLKPEGEAVRNRIHALAEEMDDARARVEA